ncbi:MAG: SulP family inorganic anion transporter [Betaproteobacteria bacterium]|nr:SulP family inorganic anion transporter [Betaproteobacteria bacterium]
MHRLQALIPRWLTEYRSGWFVGDLSAGVVVALMLVPQSMAYAIVSGLPPVTGLYASLLPSLVYAWFGSSSVQSVGTMAITSVMMGTSLASLQPASSDAAIAMSAAVALMAGLVLVFASALRLGFLSALISRPVLSGFTTGSSVMIALSQLRYLLGPQDSGLSFLGMPLPQIHAHSLAVGLASLTVLWLAKAYASGALRILGLSPRATDMVIKLIPFSVILIATLLVAWLGLDGIRLVGDVPAGLPGLYWPALDQWERLVPTALSMALMVFLFGQSSSVVLGRKRGERILPDRELFALGSSNLAAALSGSFPVTGSISRSAVNFQAGANSQLASVISVLLLATALSSSTAWLSLLPMPALAAMIILAVFSMMDWAMLVACWRVDRRDALACLATALAVILVGFNEGLVAGLLLSLGFALASLGLSGLGLALRGHAVYDLEPLAARSSHSGYRVRFKGALIFANAETACSVMQNDLMSLAAQARKACVDQSIEPEALELCIDLSAVSDLDMTAIQVLAETHQALSEQGFVLGFILPPEPLRARLEREGRLLSTVSKRVGKV